MKKRISIPALVLVLLLAACAPSAGTPVPEPTPAPESSPGPGGGTGPEETPGPGGGLLVPYVGERVFDRWGYGEYYMRGLMTLEGEAVTQPVYTGAEPMYFYDERGTDTYAACRYLPVYLLTQGVPDGGGAFTTERLGVSALDGSWRTGLTYTHYAAGADGFLLADETHIELWDFEGTLQNQWSLAELGYSEAEPPSFGYGFPDMTWQDGMLALDFRYQDSELMDGGGTATFLNTDTGALLSLDGDYFRRFCEGLAPWPDGESYGYVDKDGAWAIPPQYSGAQPFYGGRALVYPTWDTFALIDKTGAPLLSGEGYLYRIEAPGGEWYAAISQDHTVAAVYDNDLSPMDFPAIGQQDAVPLDGGFLSWRAGGGFHLWSPGEGEQFVPSQADYMNLVHGLVWTSDQALYTRDGEVVIPPGVYSEIPPFPCQDEITGEPYLVAYRDGGQDLLTLDGQVLGSTDHRPSYDTGERQSIFLIGGLVESIGTDSVAYSDREGNTVYTCPLAPPDSGTPVQ